LLYEDCVGVLVSNADDITVAYYGEQSQTSFQLDALDWLDLQWVAYPSCPGLWVPLNKCNPDIYMKEWEEGGPYVNAGLPGHPIDKQVEKDCFCINE